MGVIIIGIISVILSVIGVILIKKYWWYMEEINSIILGIVTGIFEISALVCLVICITLPIKNAQDFRKLKEQETMLRGTIKQIDFDASSQEALVYAGFVNSIVEYNSELSKYKSYLDNPFMSIFYSNAEELNYIELPKK